MLKITTDHKPRALISYDDLPEPDRSWFDYLDDTEKTEARFVKFRGSFYDVMDTMVTETPEWDSFIGETYFSGVLFRITENRYGELSVVVGHAYDDGEG